MYINSVFGGRNSEYLPREPVSHVTPLVVTLGFIFTGLRHLLDTPLTIRDFGGNLMGSYLPELGRFFFSFQWVVPKVPYFYENF